MKKKAVVLLSGGLDSTVNLFLAQKEFEVVQVLNFNYGQKSVKQEQQASRFFAEQLKLPYKSIDLLWLSEVSHSTLTTSKNVPEGDEIDITSHEKSTSSAKSVWVPNRNGLFINVAGAYADYFNAEYIIPGFNKEEAETFPDNSVDFIDASNKALSYSTKNQAQVYCFTADKDKGEIADLAISLKIPLSKLWPCYNNQDKKCGKCESCLRFARAFRDKV